MSELEAHIPKAKELLTDHLLQHDDAGVRLLAATVELSNDDPRVLTIARALAAKGTADQ